MSHLRSPRTIAPVLLSLGLAELVILAGREESCQLPARETKHTLIHAAPVGEKSNNPSHCLIYGKDCLGESLRSQ